jgi:hypothetical protein
MLCPYRVQKLRLAVATYYLCILLGESAQQSPKRTVQCLYQFLSKFTKE